MKLKEKAISMRKSGMSVVEVANALGIHKGTVSVYTGHLGIRVVKPKENKGATKAECFRLYAMGFSPYEIAINLNLTRNTVYQYVRLGNAVKGKYKYDPKENRELCKALFIDGYPIEQISLMTGLRLSEVKRYTSKNKPHQVKPRRDYGIPRKLVMYDLYFNKCYTFEEIAKKFNVKKSTVRLNINSMVPIKLRVKMDSKKVKLKPSRIEQRAVLGKGITSGIYDTTVVLRDDRDRGRLISFLYSDITDAPTIPISIRVKDDVSDEEAASRWCKRMGKKNWRLIN